MTTWGSIVPHGSRHCGRRPRPLPAAVYLCAKRQRPPSAPPAVRPHGAPEPRAPHSPAAVQPHVPTAQPGPVVLVLVGGEVLDDGRLPGLQRVRILVRAVSATQRGARTALGGL